MPYVKNELSAVWFLQRIILEMLKGRWIEDSSFLHLFMFTRRPPFSLTGCGCEVAIVPVQARFCLGQVCCCPAHENTLCAYYGGEEGRTSRMIYVRLSCCSTCSLLVIRDLKSCVMQIIVFSVYQPTFPSRGETQQWISPWGRCRCQGILGGTSHSLCGTASYEIPLQCCSQVCALH